jgi:hypothetical protein
MHMKDVYLGKMNKGLICQMSIPIYCNFLSNVYPNYSTNTISRFLVSLQTYIYIQIETLYIKTSQFIRSGT